MITTHSCLSAGCPSLFATLVLGACAESHPLTPNLDRLTSHALPAEALAAGRSSYTVLRLEGYDVDWTKRPLLNDAGVFAVTFFRGDPSHDPPPYNQQLALFLKSGEVVITASGREVCGTWFEMNPVAMNNGRKILVDCRDDWLGGSERAAVWSKSEGTRWLEPNIADVFSINNDGYVAGAARVDFFGAHSHALVWSPTGASVDLGALLSLEPWACPSDPRRCASAAWAINESGAVIGTTHTAVFFRSATGELEDVTAAFPSVPPWGLPTLEGFRALNNHGVAVGDGFMWSKEAGYIEIPIDAVDINESGIVAGNTPNGAAVWSSREGLRLLEPQGTAYAINGRGDVIGYVPDLGAVIWHGR